MNSDHNVSAEFQPMPDFSFTVSTPAPAAVAPGQSATSTITVDSLSGFNDMVSFTCSVSPAVMLAPTCSGISLTPPAGNSVTGTLTIRTSAPELSQSLGGQTAAFYALLLPMAGMMLAFAPTRPRYGRYQPRFFVGLSMVLVLAGLLLLPACGGGNSTHHGSSGTPSGNYTITIKGTASGGLQHSTTITLKVQ
jgi:hypothetical protein